MALFFCFYWALEQINRQGYAEKYQLSGKMIVGIGVNFSHREREIGGCGGRDLRVEDVENKHAFLLIYHFSPNIFLSLLSMSDW